MTPLFMLGIIFSVLSIIFSVLSLVFVRDRLVWGGFCIAALVCYSLGILVALQ